MSTSQVAEFAIQLKLTEKCASCRCVLTSLPLSEAQEEEVLQVILSVNLSANTLPAAAADSKVRPFLSPVYHLQGSAQLYSRLQASLHRQLGNWARFAVHTCLAAPAGLDTAQVWPALMSRTQQVRVM